MSYISNEKVTTVYGNTIRYYSTTNSTNGAGRFIFHFLSLGLKDHASDKHTKSLAMRKYTGKQFGGGFVMQSYNVREDLSRYFRERAQATIASWIDLSEREDENGNEPKNTFSNLLKVIKSEKGYVWAPPATLPQWRHGDYHKVVVAEWVAGIPSTLDYNYFTEALREYMQSWGLDLQTEYCEDGTVDRVDESEFFLLVADVILDRAKIEDNRIAAKARRAAAKVA